MKVKALEHHGSRQPRRWRLALAILLGSAVASGLVARFFLTSSRSSQDVSTAPDPPTEAPTDEAEGALPAPAPRGANNAPPMGRDPCRELQLLDVESGPNGAIQGIWLRKAGARTSRVRTGEVFAHATLTEVLANPDRRSVSVRFDHASQPCELFPVRGIALPNLASSEHVSYTHLTLPPNIEGE